MPVAVLVALLAGVGMQPGAHAQADGGAELVAAAVRAASPCGSRG